MDESELGFALHSTWLGVESFWVLAPVVIIAIVIVIIAAVVVVVVVAVRCVRQSDAPGRAASQSPAAFADWRRGLASQGEQAMCINVNYPTDHHHHRHCHRHSTRSWHTLELIRDPFQERGCLHRLSRLLLPAAAAHPRQYAEWKVRSHIAFGFTKGGTGVSFPHIVSMYACGVGRSSQTRRDDDD